MIQLLEGSDIEGLLQCMVGNIKTQVDNPQMLESSFTLGQVHLYINFHK